MSHERAASPEYVLFPEPEREGRRAGVYIAVVVALALLALLVHLREYQSGPYFHTLLETVATILALTIGALGLVRFYSRRRNTYLFLGTGFLGTGLLDGYHAVVSSPFLTAPDDPTVHDLTAWTWIASRLFLGLFLFVSWFVWFQEREREEAEGRTFGRETVEKSVYITAGMLTLAVFIFFAASPLVSAYRPDAWLSRPGELIPALFFGLALGGYLNKGDWKRDTFEHWLVVALIVSVTIHVAFMPFSVQQHDLPVLAAHLLKVTSYAAVLGGLMASVYVTLRREVQASRAILEANQALASEIKTRRKAERVLQGSEERLQDFLDNATDLIQSTDPMGRILYVNEAWKRTLGFEEDDLEGTDILSVIHPDSRDAFRDAIRRIFQGETIPDFEVVFRAKDGRSVICSGSANCRFEGGRPVATRSIFRNVSEERRAEDELARSQANIRALFESTGDAIWSVDYERHLITFNTAFALTVEAMSGRAPNPGDPVETFMAEEDREWFRECYERALSGVRFSAIREETVDGDQRIFELYFNPIEGENGADGVVVFSKDITQRRQVEEALRRAKVDSEEANQAKSQFMANMSHELRTPLNSVIGFANILLKKGDALKERERGFLERILANGKHLLSLINEILDLSKIEAGRMELELEAVDPADLVDDTLAQLEGQVSGKPVELRAELEGAPGVLNTDPGKLKQILINLVGNALKFTEKGEVVVRVESDAPGTPPDRIRVRDTGVGIPDDRLEAIFEAFQQADGTTTRRFGGTGLGLTISRSLCNLMGYDLTVASEVGKGSTFTVHLAPGGRKEESEVGELDAPPKERWAPASLDGASDLEGKTVLVVDDELDSRTVLTHYLEELGCAVVTAADGVEGLEVARHTSPDLITVDLMMPRMSGWEMLRALKKDPALRDVPAVVVSIVAEEGSGQFLGAVDLLSKPVDREEFAAALRRNIAKPTGRVLVVDDNPDTRSILLRYLREAGLVAHAVSEGEAALEVLADARVDLVLLDLMMPGKDGITVLKELREQPYGSGVPVVVLTAKDLTAEEEGLLAEHASAVIMKDDDVEEKLRHVLDLHFGAGEAADREA